MTDTAGAQTTRKIAGIASVVVVAAAATWVAVSMGGNTEFALAERANAEQTLFFANVNRLNQSYKRGLRVLRTFPAAKGFLDAVLDQHSNDAEPFSPESASAWESVGIDPVAGVAVVLDKRFATASQVTPLIWVATDDLSRAIGRFSQWRKEPIPVVRGEVFSAVVLGNIRFIFGPALGATVVAMTTHDKEESVDQAVQRLGLMKVTQDDWVGEQDLSHSQRFKRALSDTMGERNAYAFVDLVNLRSYTQLLATVIGMDMVGAYLSEQVESAGVNLGADGLQARLVTTDGGQRILEQVLRVPGPSPKWSEELSAAHWSAVKWTINLTQILSGLQKALPPNTPPEMASALSMAKMALHLTVGINWETLTRAFSGHFFAAVTPPVPDAEPAQFLFGVGVSEKEVAISTFQTVGLFLKKKLDAFEIKPGEDADRFVITGMGVPMEASFTDDRLIFRRRGVAGAGQSPAADAKLKTARAALDREALFGGFLDARPLIPKELPKLVTSDTDMMGFISEPFIAAQLELDNRGLLWTQTHPQQPEDVLALMKALPSLSLPFEFPVKL